MVDSRLEGADSASNYLKLRDAIRALAKLERERLQLQV